MASELERSWNVALPNMGLSIFSLKSPGNTGETIWNKNILLVYLWNALKIQK